MALLRMGDPTLPSALRVSLLGSERSGVSTRYPQTFSLNIVQFWACPSGFNYVISKVFADSYELSVRVYYSTIIDCLGCYE